MRLPYIPVRTRSSEGIVRRFGGIDERLQVPDGAFAAMQNLSARFFPAIATRPPRGAEGASLTSPHGLLWKNGLFYVDGTSCYYNGRAISDLTVTDDDKQLVGMGAFICIFPDKLIYNTKTGQKLTIDKEYAQSGAMTFEELSTDSVFCKISGTGLGSAFNVGDGVTFYGVNDDTFLVEGQPAVKTITEQGSGYIVVTASIQHQTSGTMTLEAADSGAKTKISLSGINSVFDVGDYVRAIGCGDEALNVSNKQVSSKASGYIIIDSAFTSKTLTASVPLTAEPYYSGASMIRILCAQIGTDTAKSFSEGDVVTFSNASAISEINGKTKTVRMAGVGYIVVDGTISEEKTQNTGATITRTKNTSAQMTVKRTKFTRASGVSIKRESQDFDFVCEHDNRLWACNSENHEIYASKLGDPTNWQCYEGISTDSYTVSVGSDGDFTGCISHMGQVLFFKERSIHVMYGAKPSNYQLDVRQAPGVRTGCDRSLTIIDETLYYVGRDGVYAYDGASPVKISDGLVGALTEAVGSQQDGRYYLSCRKAGEQTLLVFDTQYRVWDREDDTEFLFATFGDGILTYCGTDGKLRTITGDTDEVIHWYMQSGVLTADSVPGLGQGAPFRQKHIGMVSFKFALDEDAHADIYMRYDDDPQWERKATVHSARRTTYTVPVIPRRCDSYQWRIEGYGGMKLLGVLIRVEGGSEINGDIQSWFRR